MAKLKERKIEYANSVGKFYSYDNSVKGAVATRGYTLEYNGEKIFVDYDLINKGVHLKTFKNLIDNIIKK